jgi:hypothetical protein
MNTLTNSQERMGAGITAAAVRGLGYACVWLVVLLMPGHVEAQAKVPPTSIEFQELKTALSVAQKQLAEERVRAAALDETRKALAESLAAANQEALKERAAHQDLLIKMEALGVDVLSVDPKSLQQRLLKAVRTTELEREQSRKLSTQLLKLSEAVVGYFQTAGGGANASPESRMLVEAELRATDEALGLGMKKVDQTPVTVEHGQVVSLDPEIGLIVLNVGRKGGIRVGMPLEILRTDRLIGTAMIVDVRDSICGAVLSQLVSKSNDVKVGDRIKPKPQEL